MVVSGRIDPRPLITKIHPFENLAEAVVEAGCGENILKMQISNPA
jgi:threonine dehydrogenase-like Zn-dependent dehydrogenase